jgi:hypothetical protein
MTDDQLMAMLEGGDPAAAQTDPGQTAQTPAAADTQQDQAAPTASTAQVPPQAEQTAVTQQAQQQQPQMVDLRALQSERQKRQELQTLLNNPQALAQHLAQMGYQIAEPDPYTEPDEAARFQVNQATLPLQQENEHLKAVLGQIQQEKAIESVRTHFGADADQYLTQFDQLAPQLSGLDPLIKAATMHGLRWADPAYQKQVIEAAAANKAEDQVTAALAGNKKPTPVTLSGITEATNPDTSTVDPERLSGRDLLAMDDKALDKLLMGA